MDMNIVGRLLMGNAIQHMKTSMKSLLERFLKAPYGFVEADVQWLVAKLFKDGEIAMFVNNEAVTLLSKSEEEIIRYLTRKEFNEKLMTEKRVKANEKQKKSVREVMKELFNVTSASDDDDAITNTNQNQNTMTVSFDAVREKVNNMTSLPDEDIEEIQNRIDEIEEIVNSKESKSKKWSKAKEIIKWIADKGVDVGIALLPLLLKIG